MASPVSLDHQVCAKCSRRLSGQVVQMEAAVFHMECLTCHTCGAGLGDEPSTITLSPEGHPLCSQCTYKCHACQLPITDVAVNTGEHMYHKACFKCHQCNTVIGDEAFGLSDQQNILCKECFKTPRSSPTAPNKSLDPPKVNTNPEPSVQPPEPSLESAASVEEPTPLEPKEEAVPHQEPIEPSVPVPENTDPLQKAHERIAELEGLLSKEQTRLQQAESTIVQLESTCKELRGEIACLQRESQTKELPPLPTSAPEASAQNDAFIQELEVRRAKLMDDIEQMEKQLLSIKSLPQLPVEETSVDIKAVMLQNAELQKECSRLEKERALLKTEIQHLRQETSSSAGSSKGSNKNGTLGKLYPTLRGLGRSTLRPGDGKGSLVAQDDSVGTRSLDNLSTTKLKGDEGSTSKRHGWGTVGRAGKMIKEFIKNQSHGAEHDGPTSPTQLVQGPISKSDGELIPGKSSGSPTTVKVGAHQLRPHAYMKPTKCEVCHDALWGKEKRCSECGAHVHIKCADKLPGLCVPQLPNKEGNNKLTSGESLASSLGSVGSITLGEGVSPLVRQCIATVEARGLEFEGIYRKSGPVSQVSRFINAFKRGETVSFDDENDFVDIMTVTSVLKQYLRDLSEPLLTYALYTPFLDTAAIAEAPKRLAAVQDILSQLPPSHYETLKALMLHLRTVADVSGLNRMTPSNLGLVFGPNLLKASNQTTFQEMGDNSAKGAVVEHLILHAKSLFPQPVPPIEPAL